MTYSLFFTDPNDANNTRQTSDIHDVNFNRTHTALSDWRATVAYDVTWEDHVFWRFDLYFDGNHLFRGFLERVNLDADRGVTQLSGRGLAKTLIDDGSEWDAFNNAAHAELYDYVDQETNWTPNITEPTGTQVADDREVQNASLTADFQDLISPAGTDIPLVAESNYMRCAQTCYFYEPEDVAGGTSTSGSESSASGGGYEQFDSSGEEKFITVSPEYELPASAINVGIRFRVPNGGPGPNFKVFFDGFQINEWADGFTVADGDYHWYLFDPSNYGGGNISGSADILLQCNTSNTEPVHADCVCVYDGRWTYSDYGIDVDETVDGNSTLAAPRLFPDNNAFSTGLQFNKLKEATTAVNVTGATINVTMVDADENPWKIAMRHSGVNYVKSGADKTTYTESFPTGNYANSVVGEIGLNYNESETRSGPTPRTGYVSQKVATWQVLVDGNDVPILDEFSVQGTHMDNIQKLADRAKMRVLFAHNENSKDLYIFRPRDETRTLPSGTQLLNEQLSRDIKGYANKVTIYGKTDPDTGDRPKITLQDDDEVARVGALIAFNDVNPNIESQADAEAEAAAELGARIQEDNRTGVLTVTPQAVAPGYAYDVTWTDDTTSLVPLERVEVTESQDDAALKLHFDRSRSLPIHLSGLSRETRRNTGAL